ncbi:MAG TPA: anaerobic glycerol-3-phosphate dehydrogenase subunit GlpB [Solirubrobacteraceae bacterium]|jgi:glycerol-3-phosphate dehydrogenase subunit B|nr:anaerobic glycerol-3-phosphate dehydrogenase subunit GlpB [Solirubrobacteraceae bacterium]
MTRELRFDAVVIGAGTAGLVAGTRMAQQGARVCVLAKGIGSTHLSPATIDVLGYGPSRVDEPGPALEKLVLARHDHPYAQIGRQVVDDALRWFSGVVADGPLPGYGYVGGLERNLRLPTAIGVLRPSAMVPETMAAGDAPGLGRCCIVGTGSLRDFHPALCAANLRRAGIEARSVTIPLEFERADMNALGIARRFDDPTWRARFCAELSPLLGADDHVGLPAALGLRDPHGVRADLEHRLGRQVFEIPSLPPSVPGMRMFEILTSALRADRGRLILGAEVIAVERDEHRVNAVSTHAAGHDARYRADAFVLATGGFASGAIELDSRWVTHERVLGLPLHGVPGPDEPRFVPTYLSEQPIARVGVAVDTELRAQGTENVFVAGAALPGAIPWREGSGEGIALSSGYRVADLIASGSKTPAEAAA